MVGFRTIQKAERQSRLHTAPASSSTESSPLYPRYVASEPLDYPRDVSRNHEKRNARCEANLLQ